jgi:hypothetical protein
MGGKSIGKSFNFGFAGTYARQPDMIINTRPNRDSGNIMFGVALMQTSDGVKNVDATLTADNFIGVAGAEVRTQLSFPDQNAGGQYEPNGPVSVFQRGSITVLCPNDMPARYGAVYVRIVAAPGRNVGDFETTADGTNNVLIPNAEWNTEKDSRGAAELVLMTRVSA